MKTSARIRYDALSLVFAALGGLILLFIIAPLVSLCIHCSGPEMLATLKDTELGNSIWLTLATSMAATLVFAVAAIPFAYLLARKNFPLKALVTGLIDVPIVIPHSAAGIALFGVLSRAGFLGRIAERIGFSFVGSGAGIALAMAFVSLPYLVNSARDGFLAVPIRLEKAALNLGANPLRVFFTVSVPLAWRPILSGLILMWARGMSEFGAVIVIAYYPMIAPTLIYERYISYGLSASSPVAVLLIVICLVVFIVLRMVSAGWRRYDRE